MTWKSIGLAACLIDHDVGRANQINTSDIQPAGRFPVIDQGQDFIAGYTDDGARVIENGLPYVIFGDHTRCFKYVDFPFVLGADGTKVLKPNPGLFDTRFFYYAALALDVPSRGYNRHFSLLKEKSIPRPELGEQRQIAMVLSAVEQAIARQERLIDLTVELKKALLRKLFAAGPRGESQKQTCIGPLPRSWSPTPLGVCCDIVSGSMSYSELTQATESTDNDAVPCMAVKVSDMNLSGNEHRFVSANATKRLSGSIAAARLVPPNAVVFPKRGAAIATNKKRLTTTWTALDPNLIAVCARDGVDAQFLFHWAQTFDLRTITEPGSTPQLNKKDLSPINLPLPATLEEQRSVAAILDAVDAKWLLHRRMLTSFRDLFRTMLRELMTTEARVQGIDISALEAAPRATKVAVSCDAG